MPFRAQQNFPLIAAIDLGSNSFHIILAKAEQNEIRILERLGEKVQLAAGLNEARELDDESIERGLDCLRRFAQLIQGLPQGAVRVVATNALREARNRSVFIRKAEAILKHPVEVISGREEARLIYLGVCHSTAVAPGKRLVIDIGGGSTEYVIGQQFDSLLRESLQMGCVSYTQRFFRDGKISSARYAQAYTAARVELMRIEQSFQRLGWQEALGSSGTFRSIAQAIQAMGLSNGEITVEGIGALKRRILKLNDVDKIDFDGVKPDRRPILPAGLAIVEAIFDALSLTQMTIAEGALREGVLNDLLGRHHHEDVRERSINSLMHRCGVDLEQAKRVEEKALNALEQVAHAWSLDQDWHQEFLTWAARVHEVGLAIAHYHYHKHGAYLIEHSDLAGFSRQDQQMLALLVRGHRRNIPQDKLAELHEDGVSLVRLCILLRFAILFHHIRGGQQMPEVKLVAKEKALEVVFPEGWLAAHPLTQADFEQEADWLKRIGFTLSVR